MPKILRNYKLNPIKFSTTKNSLKNLKFVIKELKTFIKNWRIGYLIQRFRGFKFENFYGRFGD